MGLKRTKISLAVLFGLVFASQSWAVLIVGGPFNNTDAGGIDTVLGQADNATISGLCGNGGNPTVEECWAESVLGIDLTYDDSKTEDVTAYATDTANVIAFELAFGGGYYLLKNSTWSAIIQNVASLDWGVVDVSSLNGGFNLNASGVVISHVTEFDGSTTTVPEPGSLALLGAGLIGLGVMGRRRRV